MNNYLKKIGALAILLVLLMNVSESIAHDSLNTSMSIRLNESSLSTFDLYVYDEDDTEKIDFF